MQFRFTRDCERFAVSIVACFASDSGGVKASRPSDVKLKPQCHRVATTDIAGIAFVKLARPAVAGLVASWVRSRSTMWRVALVVERRPMCHSK